MVYQKKIKVYIDYFLSFLRPAVITFLLLVSTIGFFSTPGEEKYSSYWKKFWHDPLDFLILTPLFWLSSPFNNSNLTTRTVVRSVFEIVLVVLVVKLFLFGIFFAEITDNLFEKQLLEMQKKREIMEEEESYEQARARDFLSFLPLIYTKSASVIVPFFLYFGLTNHPNFLKNKNRFGSSLVQPTPFWINFVYLLLIFLCSFFKNWIIKGFVASKLKKNKTFTQTLKESVRDALFELMFFVIIRLFSFLFRQDNDPAHMSWTCTIYCFAAVILDNIFNTMTNTVFKKRTLEEFIEKEKHEFTKKQHKFGW